MKRFFAFFLALVLILGCLSGCKDSSDPGSTESTNAAATEIPVTTNPDGLSLEEDGIVYESLAQKAVVKTALAYLARSTRIQYDDTNMLVNSSTASADPVYRWQYKTRQNPEDYTVQYTGYTNCAAFTYDVYWAALDYKIGAYTTKNLIEKTGKDMIYKYIPTGKETADEKAAMEQEFRSNLKMGDIIVIRYSGSLSGNGHAMLYVGEKVLEGVDGYKGVAAENTEDNGPTKDYVYDIIHSTGSSFSYSKGEEKYEAHGSIQMMSVDALFRDETSRRYVFANLESIGIVRPLEVFDKEVPTTAQNRMLYMNNIIAEKLSSHTAGMTAGPGDQITYNFSVTNKNKTDVTLAVKDTLPQNITFVSSENCTVSGSALSWTVTVPAGKTLDVTYTVKVKEDEPAGHYVQSTSGTVGGIPVNCPKVYIGRTLTEGEQKVLLDSVKALKGTESRGLELANVIYGQVLGQAELLGTDFDTVMNELFREVNGFSYLEWEGAYPNLIAPGLFGGRYVPQRAIRVQLNEHLQRYENIRTRLPYPDQLVIGDILIAEADTEGKAQKLYLFTGENMLDLNNMTYVTSTEILTKAMAYNRFAILRPSLMLDKL